MLIIGIILIVLFFALRATFRDEDRFRVDNGPILTPEQKKANYQSVRRFVENNPNMNFVKEKLPEYVRDIQLTREYEDLERRHKAGSISEADYQIEFDELSKKIDQPVLPNKRRWLHIKK